MKKIQYHYTNTLKQVFLASCFIWAILRFLVTMEIIIFQIEEYYEAINIPLTMLMYAALFAFLVVLFLGHKLCYSLYDGERIVYRNTLLRREKTFLLSNAHFAVFDTFGVKFFAAEEDEQSGKKPLFFLPFFRDGIIEAVQINGLFKMLKERENIRVIKKFKVLPGYGKKWKLLSVLYGFLTFALLTSCITPLTVVIILFQNFA